MNEEFENDLNSEKNLKLTFKFVKELNLTKNIPTSRVLIDIPPVITKNKMFFGLCTFNDATDHVYYKLFFDGKVIKIIKFTWYDDGDNLGMDYYQDLIVNIKLKKLKKINKITNSK